MMESWAVFVFLYITNVSICGLLITSSVPFPVRSDEDLRAPYSKIFYLMCMVLVAYSIAMLYIFDGYIGILICAVSVISFFILLATNFKKASHIRQKQEAFLLGLYELTKDGAYTNQVLGDYFEGLKFNYSEENGYFELFSWVNSSKSTEEEAVIDIVLQLITLSKKPQELWIPDH